MADDLCGTWKIVECISLTGAVESTGIEGTEFHLDESGDVCWKIPEGTDPMPFFTCETYEVDVGDMGAKSVMKFSSLRSGHIIEFKIMKDENPDVAEEYMLLTYEQCCMLQCQKVSVMEIKDEEPFSFLNALEEGYFSDAKLVADTGKEFAVHTTILSMVEPEVNWLSPPTPLDGLSEEVLESIVHFIYTESLPNGLKDDAAHGILKAVSNMTGFKKLAALCNTFLKNNALRQKITTLVNEMHASADKIIDYFSGKTVKDGTSTQSPSITLPQDDNVMNNPAKLVYAVKQSLREASIASAKLVILCDLFSHRSHELSREERHGIIKYAKSRLPIFLSQLRRFLEVLKKQTNSLSSHQRIEIASYLVPEIEESLELLSSFVDQTCAALEQIISNSKVTIKPEKTEKPKMGKVGDVLSKSLKKALHRRELLRLKHYHARITRNIRLLMHNKESFTEMSPEKKITFIAKAIERVVDEVPYSLTRIEELSSALDDKITWKEWKYIFKLGTSKVAWVLSRAQVHRGTLQPLVDKTCSTVHREAFNQSLVTLGLYDKPQAGTDDGAAIAMPSASTSCQPLPSVEIRYAQMNSTESLCISPHARDSELSSKCSDLLSTSRGADMVFEIICVQESGDTVIDHTNGDSYERTDRSKEVEIFSIPAHCVIVASRCDWFRRALLSGMRESIDKKITIHDTDLYEFRLFLEFVYTGQLDTTDMTTEAMSELIALADRYEMDGLKVLCEYSLKRRLDADSALCLFSLADQYNARILRLAALTFIVECPENFLETEIFADLPEHLQKEIENASCQGSRLHKLTTSCHSSCSSNCEMEELLSELELNLGDRHASTSSSAEELPVMEDQVRLEACISALRDIVGDDVPREELVRVSLAADYDVNRAINYYFTS